MAEGGVVSRLEAARQGGHVRDLEVPHGRLDFGPEHPFGDGHRALTLKVDGERIVDVDVVIGFAHRGFEKACEGLRWEAALPYVERLGGAAGLLFAVGYCEAVERMLGLQLTERAQWLRVVSCELARMLDHANRFVRLAQSVGARAAVEFAAESRERIFEVIEALCGARFHADFVRIGGFVGAPPPRFAELASERLARAAAGIADFDAVLVRNGHFAERLRGTAIIDAAQCRAWSVTGPALRAAGEPSDLRKDAPSGAYAKLDFAVAVGESGDAYDRLLVCLEEFAQSRALIGRCLEALSDLGPGPLSVVPASAADREVAERASPAERLTRGIDVPAGRILHAIEAGGGVLGFHLESEGGPTATRIRCRAPGFFSVQVLPQMLRGERLEDVGPVLALLGSVGAECDR